MKLQRRARAILLGLTLFTVPGFASEGGGVSVELARKPAQADQEAEGPRKGAEEIRERYKDLELFQRVLSLVEQNYVEKTENRKLIYGALKGMLETLDPHSNFLTPEIYRDMKVDTSGRFGGLGIELGVKDRILTVVAPMEETPAWQAGLKPGDRIVKIDGESTRGMNLEEAVSRMRGKPGTGVKLSVFRDGMSKVKELLLKRATIKIQSVKSEEIEAGYGYVRLSSFSESAAADIRRAIERLEQKNRGPLRGLVLDLRTNPGGLLDQAVDVSSLFIDEGVVVSTIGRNKDQKEVKHARRGMARKDLPLAILVNSSTASAAEIVAGALQDHHRAIVLGQTTFGKGSVQTVVDLGEDVGLKLTIARYYTPSGRSIQEKGVVPDVLLEDFDPKLLAAARRKSDSFRERDLKGHMINEEGELPPEVQELEDSGDGEAVSSRDRSEYKDEELKKLADGRKKSEPSVDDEFKPNVFAPREDYQVREAIKVLRSYEVFRRITQGTEPQRIQGAGRSPVASLPSPTSRQQKE